MAKNNSNIKEVQTSVDAQGIDRKALKERILSQLSQELDNNTFDSQEFERTIMKSYYEALAQAEMKEHLGYDSYERNREVANSRNGYNSKTVRGEFGEIEVNIPRDRNASFEPQVIKKRQTTTGHFSKNIISLYARGMTTREIEEHIQELYGVEVSPQFISRVTESLEEDILEWQNRALEKVYPVIYVDGLRVSTKAENNAGAVIKKCVYVVLGVPISGQREVLGLWIEETEGARFWLKVFNDIKSRGVEDILILCGDGLTGLDKAVESVYPKTDLQLCVVHQVRNTVKFVSHKDRKQLCADMKKIYSSPTLEGAEAALENFIQNWEKKYPTSVISWKNNWHKISTFFKYPLELRKFIYTTNSIESLNSQLRKNISNRKVFPNDKAVLKILYLNIKNFTKKWTKNINWNIIINQLSILFNDRLSLETTE